LAEGNRQRPPGQGDAGRLHSIVTRTVADQIRWSRAQGGSLGLFLAELPVEGRGLGTLHILNSEDISDEVLPSRLQSYL